MEDYAPLLKLEDGEYDGNQLDSPIPEGLQPWLYWIHVMPIAPRRVSKGGIIMPDQRQDAEHFMQSIGRIAAIGPQAFKAPHFKELGLTEETTPKVGDLIRYSGARNRSFFFKQAQIIEIRDDWIRSIVRAEDVSEQSYRFWR